MKRVGFIVLLLVLFSSVGVVCGDLPRHVDPAQYELVEPDPEVLFLLYHNMFEGMILENMTVQDEWLRMIGEVYSVDELAPLLEEYGGEIRVQVGNLNLTRYHLDLAIRYIGEYNLSAARSSFFDGLRYLEASNETIPVLRGTTIEIGEALKTDPELLLGDLDRLEGLVGDYRDFAQLLADFMSGEELDAEAIEEIKDEFADVLDPEILDQIEDYLDDLKGGLELDELVGTGLSMEVNVSRVWVGDGLRVSGLLRGGGVGLGDRVLVLRVGDESYNVVTGDDGSYVVDIRAPYLYESVVELRGFYWPKGGDSMVYSPATTSVDLELLYRVPELVLEYESLAYPGLGWNVSGRLVFDGVGLEGFVVDVDGFGRSVEVVTDTVGGFSGSLMVPYDFELGSVKVSVSVMPSDVYSGVMESSGVRVVFMPLRLEVVEPGLVFTGFPVGFRYSVSVDGVELSGCRVRVVGEDDQSIGYSIDGGGVVRVWVPLLRLGGRYDWRVVADPVEPWIGEASVSGGFMVVNSLFALFGACVAAGGVYYLRGYLGRKSDDSMEFESVPVPVVEPVAEPVISGSFSGLFMAAIRVVERLSGAALKPSDTLREYLARVADGLGDRVGGLFKELVMRYEAWLYGRPHDVELERVEVLVSGLEDEDEA